MESIMKNSRNILSNALLGIFALTVPATAAAQDEGWAEGELPTHVRAVGELSPGTSAPSVVDMESAARDLTNPTRLTAMLEYGERVECHACVPILEERLLTDGNPEVREIAAWWLARRPFGFAAVYHDIRTVLESDGDETRRARAAEALGNFAEPAGVAHLGRALTTDTSSAVRVAAIHGIAEINSPEGLTFISTALGDSDAAVQAAALQMITRVNFFDDYDAIIPLLAHADGTMRRRAATVIGSLRVEAAVTALAAVLRGDTDSGARREAAWALGRIGGAAAEVALSEVLASNPPAEVRNAINVAMAIR
jgi:HEAT repeats